MTALYTLAAPGHPPTKLEAFSAFAALRAWAAIHDPPHGTRVEVTREGSTPEYFHALRIFAFHRVLSETEREVDRQRAAGVAQIELFGGALP